MRWVRGFTLVEMLVAVALASLMSIAVISIYVKQSTNIAGETQRDISQQVANHSFDIVSRLLRQAEKTSIRIEYPETGDKNEDSLQHNNDAIIIDFLLPEGYNIWPNDKPPYINNAVRLSWSNRADSEAPQLLQMAKAESLANLNDRPLQTIAGSNAGDAAVIINFDMWPMRNQKQLGNNSNDSANAGYLVKLTTRTGLPDYRFTNNSDTDGTLKNFRTHTVSSIIFPRN